MMEKIFINTLYLLALINPVSKISILSVFTQQKEWKETFFISLKATLVAIFILVLLMFAGEFILNKIFQVDLYSLEIAGGIVLFWAGFGALRKGIFFEHSTQEEFSDISMVPLACPMIAGPATITAVIALSINDGIIQTAVPTLLAIFINFISMIFSISIGKILKKFNLLGALIRLTGLIVMTMGVQMVIKGISVGLKLL